ncbi:MAG: hypothetical protein KAI20_03575, partial [Thermoplasmatales archaeon]|nr:hypothetical protein [Thermoplasmatales archaeon]
FFKPQNIFGIILKKLVYGRNFLFFTGKKMLGTLFEIGLFSPVGTLEGDLNILYTGKIFRFSPYEDDFNLY